MGIVKEFKQFAMKGNVVDMAVGIIIGAAFGKIVSSLVADVIMPPIGMLIGGITFTDIVISLRHAVTDPATGKIIKEAVNLKLGNFLQTVFDFLIVAFAIFMMIKGMNRMKKKEEETPAAPTEPTAQEKLLTEIRDLLKK
jgi:large conductance mechanosensitive channel